MKFSPKDLFVKQNFIEIRKRHQSYWRIYIYRSPLKNNYEYFSLPFFSKDLFSDFLEVNGKRFCSIEVQRKNILFFFLLREPDQGFEKFIENFKQKYWNSFNLTIEDLSPGEIEKSFWNKFQDKINNVNIKFGENWYEFSIKNDTFFVTLYSIKKPEVLLNILDLIKSYKINDAKLYITMNSALKKEVLINIAIQTENIEKTKEFFTLISNSFPRESIGPYIPSESLLHQYLLKFLVIYEKRKNPSIFFYLFRSPERILKKFGFEEVRPMIYIHKSAPISVILLKKTNLRQIKYYLKTYYLQYRLIFWTLNSKVFKFLRDQTKLSELKYCQLKTRRNRVDFMV